METEDKGTGSGAQSDEGATAELASALSGGNMSTLHKYVLRKNRVTIKEELELSVVDYLVSKGVFTLAHSEDILAEKTRRDKAGRLLDLLEIRGSTAFDALVDSLKKTQRHFAETFEQWSVEAAKTDKEVIHKFIHDDETVEGRAVLPLKISKIRVEQRSGSSVQAVEFHVGTECLLEDDPRSRLMRTRLQEFAASVFSFQSGSINLLLSFETQTDLSKFWLSYNDGSLQDKLAPVLVTEDMRQRYPGAEFSLIMDVDIEQYVNTARQLDAHNRHQKAAATESLDSTSECETVDLLKKYAEVDIAIKLKYLHGEDDFELKEAQAVLENRLFREKDSRCMEALSQYLESRGMMLTDDSKSGLTRLRARTLNLSLLSQLDAEFSWSLDATHFASLLLDNSIIEAAKGHPLNISCYLKSVRVGHITGEELSLWTRLKELETQIAQQSAGDEHAEIQRYMARLTTGPPTDITYETSGFCDDLEIASTAYDVESTASFPVAAAVDRPVYEMGDPEKRGILVIINNSVFGVETHLGERTGSDIDAAKLHTVFTDLGFRVQTMQNLRAAEMLEFLARSAETAGESGCSCFVSAILTHGDKKIVFGTDGSMIQTQTLLNIITSVKKLAGKPKIFLIQANNGLKSDEGMLDENSEAGVKPETADLLVCHAAAPGYMSYRTITAGSWFVNAIGQVFADFGKTEDVLSLMTRVGDAVSKLETLSVDPKTSRLKQMPTFQSSLTKTLYFTPPPKI